MTDYRTIDGLLWARTQVLLKISLTMSKVIHGETDIETGRDELSEQVAGLFNIIENAARNQRSG
jgi:hypothetical protein